MSLEIVATDWMREVFEPTVRMIPPEYRNQIEPAQFFHEVLTHRWYLAEAAGHDVSMGAAVQSYIEEYLPDYRIDTQVMKAIVEEQDSGVVDDRESYDADDPVHAGGTEGQPYDPEDDPDAAVWAAG